MCTHVHVHVHNVHTTGMYTHVHVQSENMVVYIIHVFSLSY